MVAHAFNPSIREVEAGRSLRLRPAWSKDTQRDPISKKKKKKKKKPNGLVTNILTSIF